MRGLAALSAALALAPACARREPPQNLVLITIDTLRADRTSLHGYDRPTTPEIDAWAARGLVFERAFSMSSWTLPSMSMLLTGKVHLNNSGSLAGDRSLAELLHERGWRTGAVIANEMLRPELGYERGFERFERVHAAPSLPEDWDAGEAVLKARAFLAQDDGRPFFLLLHLFDPHHPYNPPTGLSLPMRADDARRAELSATLLPEDRAELTDAVYAQIEWQRALYDAEVQFADRALGELFDELEQRDLAARTLVILTADHGEGLWQRRTPADEPDDGSYFPPLYQRHGAQLFSEQVHVPLVLRGPGVPAGRRGAPVSLLDVLPTALRLLGVAAPAGLDGRDLLEPESAEQPLFAVCSRGVTVTVGGRWRLHHPSPARTRELGLRPELFDLERDPGEKQPLVDAPRERELAALVDGWIDAYRHTLALPEEVGRGQLEQLRALGYAGEAEALEQELERAGGGR